MIVLDASVLVDLLLDTPPRADTVRARITTEGGLHAPHLVDAEVGQALRREIRRGALTMARVLGALMDLAGLGIERHPHLPHLPRALELRENLTVYDGLYVALAEAFEAPLLTRDRAVAEAAGPYGELI